MVSFDNSGLMDIYSRLFLKYGPQYWWPGENALEIMIGAILAQGVAWSGAERALGNLKNEGLLDVATLRCTSDEELAALIKPSLYFNIKTRRIRAFIDYLGWYHGDDIAAFLNLSIDDLRKELLGISGIGEETADDIILYAANKPTFVVDAYTKRILVRLGIAPVSNKYDSYRTLFMDNLPHQADIFNEFHALLDRHGSSTCTKIKPGCNGCCLIEICRTGIESGRVG